MPAKIVPGRNALRSISGRKAGQDHAMTQCPLRGERAAERCQKQLFPSTVHRPPKWNVGEDCAVTQCRRLRREVMLAGARKNPLSSLVVKRCEKPPSRRAHTPPQAVPPLKRGFRSRTRKEHAKMQGCLRQEASQVHRQRFSVLRIGRNGAKIVPGRKADLVRK